MTEDEVREVVRDELTTQAGQDSNVRRIIREELSGLVKSDRYTFLKDIELFNGRGIIFPSDTGAQVGTNSNEKIGFWGVTPIVQPTIVSSPGISSVSGTGDDSTVNSNFSSLKSAIDGLRTMLDNIGIGST